MDLSVNLTMLVQIGNFLVAYLLITRVLLKPGYAAVAADTNKEKQLKSNIVARQELIAHKQLYKADRWKLFQDHFHKQKPEIAKALKLVHPIDEIELSELTAEQLANLSAEISSAVKPLVTKSTTAT